MTAVTTTASTSSIKANKLVKNSSSNVPTFGACVATFCNPRPNPNGVIMKKRKGASTSNADTDASVRRRARKCIFDAGTTEGDISEHLLSAVSASDDITKRGRFLRSVFRRAVEKQYDSVMALARVDTVMLSGRYEWTESETCRVLGCASAGIESTPAKLTIVFHKGGAARSSFEETVDLLAAPLIKAVLCVSLGDPEREGREILKPINMAGCSPRIYWSLVYHITKGQGGVVSLLQFIQCYESFPCYFDSFQHQQVVSGL